MIFAKSSKAASRLSDMIKNHNLKKYYIAIVNGIMENKTGEFKDYLFKEENGNTIVSKKGKGKEAILKYKVLEENISNNLSLIEIELLTGRHHQIRVQFSSRNHPLYGDQRYGKNDNMQIALWAYKVEFIHPVKKEKMIIQCMPERKDGWKMFDIKI